MRVILLAEKYKLPNKTLELDDLLKLVLNICWRRCTLYFQRSTDARMVRSPQTRKVSDKKRTSNWDASFFLRHRD